MLEDTRSSEIISIIRQDGPLTVADYMELCLSHPSLGYYQNQNPFGTEGDFITAPEVSQMFGELIGVWCLHLWCLLGKPNPFHLVELGPGQGTLMMDLCRVAMIDSGFSKSCAIHLVETSAFLTQIQKRNLQHSVCKNISWHKNLDSIPSGSLVFIANEFFDALPVHQYIKRHNGWHERLISCEEKKLVWIDDDVEKSSKIPHLLQDAKVGSIFESAPVREAFSSKIAMKLTENSGAAIIIDYGFSGPKLGDSFQAVAHHQFANPLSCPGCVDLTSHVDFSTLIKSAEQAGIRASGPISQSQFLHMLGITLRAEKLICSRPDKAQEIDLALARLTNPEQMGLLFKVVAFTPQNMGIPFPFDTPENMPCLQC